MFKKMPQSSSEMYGMVLSASIRALKLNTYMDNFDADRFNMDGKDHSEEFNSSVNAYYFDWFFKNANNLYSAFVLLDSDDSRVLYLYLIAFRLAGHFSVKIPVGFNKSSNEYQKFKEIEAGCESLLESKYLFKGLKHFDYLYDEKRYVIDCMGLEYYLCRHQYYYHVDGIKIQPVEGDYVVDGGACLGDSALVFSQSVGEKGRVYAFDPVADHIDVIKFNIKQFPLKNVDVMPFGLSDKNIYCDPIVINTYAPGFSANNHRVPLRSIDDLVATGAIERVDFIKLDIEGSELEALRGAHETILKFKPKLAISLYHKPDDVFDIILYLKGNYDFYEMYIDHYSIHQEETVLYCINKIF